MNKQAFLPGLAAKAVGFTAGKVLPAALTTGYKGLVRPAARMAFKHPGMAITGAIMPGWIGGYMNSAAEKGIRSMPRSLPKFASALKIRNPKSEIRNSKQGEEVSERKYPAICYKIDGFEKMAAGAETAHRLVKKAFLKDVLKGIFGIGRPSMSTAIREEGAKALAKELFEPDLTGSFARNISEVVAKHKNTVTQALDAIKPKGIREIFASLRGVSPIVGALAIGLPAYHYGHKAYNNYLENKATDASYNTMLGIYPELQRENPQNTRQYFDYIKQYSPTVAKNPHAAGAIVKRFASTGGMAMDSSVIKSLLDVEKVKNNSGHDGALAAIGRMI